MSATVSLGINTFTGLAEHIEEASRNNKYHCRECEEPLTVVQGEINEWHFRHRPDSKCIGNYDKALHDYAVQLLLENNRIVIAENRRINYDNPQKEQWIDNKRSDVKVVSDNIEMYFEIVVTNDMDDDKLSCYTVHQINCVRIDLTDPGLRKASPDEIKFAVLEDGTNKELLNWNTPNLSKQQTPGSWREKVALILSIVAMAGVARLMCNRPKKKRRPKRIRH